jgi:hypothetical protein
LKPRDRLLEIRPADEIALGAPDEQRVAARIVDRLARGAHPLDGMGKIVEWMRGVSGRILDGERRHTGLDGESHTLGHAGGLRGKAAFEVGVNRQIRRFDHLAQVRERHLARDAVVRTRA